MERRGLQLQEMLPSGIARALRNGDIDAGPVPLVDTFHLGERFEPVSGFCISTMEKARSVLFYSQRPIEELTGARVGVTGEAGASLHLLRVLLQAKHKVRAEEYVSMEDDYDAFLLTDDQALRRRRGARGYPHRYDLGEEWFQWTGLPFVYSRWFIRKGMDPREALLLEDTLYVGLEEGVEALFHGSEPRDSLLMLPKDIVEYIQGFRFFMGLSEYKAVDLFRQYLDRIELKGLKFAAMPEQRHAPLPFLGAKDRSKPAVGSWWRSRDGQNSGTVLRSHRPQQLHLRFFTAAVRGSRLDPAG